ncbi:MAG TPA: YlxR family protein [Actinomycetales bacterium]|nr:YlxR family protein [Actinomycetales bacterium]
MAKALFPPVRTCIGCGGRALASNLVRWVARDGNVRLDPKRREEGRGAWLHPSSTCLEQAERRRAFPRALRAPVDTGTAADQLRLVMTDHEGQETAPGPKESGLEADGHPMSTQR